MRADGEGDEVARNAGVHDYLQIAGTPEGRHGAEFAIGEKPRQIRFIRKRDVRQSQLTADFGQIHELIGRHHGDSEARAAQVDHRLGEVVRAHSFRVRGFERRPRRRMDGMGIANLLNVEIFKPKTDD